MTQESACLLRAIRGPVMLITIGTLFALDNFTPFGFSRTWPILLVVVGVLNLGQSPRRLRGKMGSGKMGYQAQWGPPRPPGAPTPPPPPPPPGSTAASTAPPGTYRGSAYETAPGGSTPRGAEPRQNREKPSTGGQGATP